MYIYRCHVPEIDLNPVNTLSSTGQINADFPQDSYILIML